jgi:L-asparaginase II
VALQLERMASAFARLAGGELDAAPRVLAAMIANPDLVEGPGWAATEVMHALSGTVAKGGAEGLLCVGLPDGTGIAFKVEDGATRAVLPAAARFLGLPELMGSPIENSRGDLVGRLRAEAGSG